jgi:hypothetical protein
MSFKSFFLSFGFLILSCESAEEKYDLETGQEEVLSREKIDEILSEFESVSFENLDDSYKSYTDPDNIIFLKEKMFLNSLSANLEFKVFYRPMNITPKIVMT